MSIRALDYLSPTDTARRIHQRAAQSVSNTPDDSRMTCGGISRECRSVVLAISSRGRGPDGGPARAADSASSIGTRCSGIATNLRFILEQSRARPCVTSLPEVGACGGLRVTVEG